MAIDETSAQLFFPFGDEEDSMTVYFEPQTDLITKMTALRYFGANGEKESWRVDFLTWQQVDDAQMYAWHQKTRRSHVEKFLSPLVVGKPE